jgi:type IV pilus assembly protein PilM
MDFAIKDLGRDKAVHGKIEGSNDAPGSLAISGDLSGYPLQVPRRSANSGFQTWEPLAFQKGSPGSMDGKEERARAGHQAKTSREDNERVGQQVIDMKLLKKSKPVVGLDIGSSAVKAIELSKSKKGYQVTGFAHESLAPDSVVDGAIMDAPTVASAIRRTLTTGKFKARGVATGVSGHSVIVKRVVLPASTEAEVEMSIQFDAEQHIPFEIAEVNMDYQVIGRAPADEPSMEVLLVVAKKDKIQNHTNVISLAGKDPQVVDIDAFALQNAFEANYKVDHSATIALLNIGASLMNINITKGGMPLFIRDVSVGGNQYTDILQKELQLNFQDAEDLKLGKTGSDGEMVGPLLESITDMLIMEVQKTFDFFRETYPTETISKVLVSGGTSRIAGLAQKIEEAFSYPTEVLNPFKSITLGPKVDAAKVTSLGPALAVAVGLALRGFD